MTWAKKKKFLVLGALFFTVLTIPQFASMPFYFSLNKKEAVITNGSHRISKPDLLDGAKNSSKINNSNKDQNLNDANDIIPKNPVVSLEPPKIDKIPTSANPAEQPKPPTAVIPTPVPEPAIPISPASEQNPTFSPPTSQPKPDITPTTEVSRTGSFVPGPDEVLVETTAVLDPTGLSPIKIPVRIITKKAPPRHKFPESDKEIENRIPYISTNAPEVIKIEVTEEYLKTLRENYLDRLKFDIEHRIDVDKQPDGSYINWKNLSGIPNDQIDWDKLKFSDEALEKIKKGHILSIRNLFINHNGDLDSNSWGPINDTFNDTTSQYARDNETRRFFSYSQWYSRTSERVKNGEFPGWTKRDVKDQWLKFGLDDKDGIDVLEYTNDDPKFADKNKSIRVVLDASNDDGYKKYINFLKKVENDPSKKISSFVIKNMGVSGVNQKFLDILSALPKKIPNLELWLEQPKNTSYLYALRNKEIDELALYTTQNSLLESWAINPLSVQKTAFIQSQDYNVSVDSDPNYTEATRVSISTFAFDPDNYKESESDPYREINLGLRMAYYVRNNERFFQGSHGRGVEDPDNNEGSNTAWPNLDLSRIPQLRSLKGLNFEFGEGNKKFNRKVMRLTLYNDTPIYTITADELNNSQFHSAMFLTGPSIGHPKNRLMFSGGNVRNMRIVGNGVRLTAEGLKNLETFYRQVGKELFDNRPIYVDLNDNDIKSALDSNGYNTSTYTASSEVAFN